MFHVILDKQANAYVSSGAHSVLNTNPLKYQAAWFASPAQAVEYLVVRGFGKEYAKRFRIMSEATAPNDLRPTAVTTHRPHITKRKSP